MIKVLIVDDEEIIREGLRKTIDWEKMNCSVVGEAEDGDDGINLIKSLKPDIVLTDIRMPGLDGLEMIAHIRSLKRDCKIIILTGFRDFEYAQKAVKVGAFRFLLKPSETSEIIAAVKDAIKEIRQNRNVKKYYNDLEKKIKYYDILNTKNEKNIKNINYYVRQAIHYMKNNYSKDLTLKTVADKLYISNWHLSKLLKKETGNTFIDILNEIRIEQAKKLLKDPKYKVYQIADKIGFIDVSYFSKLFKKLTGMTCMEYRNKVS